jgi:hypothetical protein
MRIILLDHSGSMGEPFSGKTEFAGRTRKTEAAIKLEAAKTELLRSIASLASPTPIALFEFTSSASLIYEGMSNDHAAIKAALDGLVADDGTDIAAALDKASEYTAKLSNVPIIQVLVISDGLSNLASAQASAQELARQRAVIINVILIDPTDDGERVARAIAVNGEVLAVTSSGEFAESISGVTKGQEELARQIDSALDEYQEEEHAITSKLIPEERLSFTAAYPGAISHGIWYSLLVYLHLAHLQQDVADIIQQRAAQIGLKPLTSSAEAITSVKRGTWLRLTPRVDGIVFNPLSQEVAWLEDIQESSFRLIADESVIGCPLLGAVEVYCGPVLIAQIPLSISVRDRDESTQAMTPTTTTTQVFNRIFASYSHKDTPIIDACVAVYEALGMYVYIDKHSLRSGQIWHAVLRQLIDKSDVLQLYWSKSSSRSKAVEDEWKYALSLVGRKGETFVRPLYWEEDWPRPPADLSHIHFAKLDLAALALQTGQSNLTEQMPQSATISVSVPALSVAVIPVLSGLPPEVQKTIREDTAYAINFLEETTGLRYYPVPTLLVDEYVIKSVRSLQTTEWAPPSEQVDQALALSDVLRAIELEFHVKRWRPKSSKIENWETLFGKGKISTAEQYDCLRKFCEGGFQATVIQYISPGWLRARAEMSGKVPGINLNQDFSAFMLTVLDHAISIAEPIHRTGGRTVRLREGSNELKLWKEAGIQIPPARDKEVRISLENTSFSTVVSALRFCRQELSLGLSSYDNVGAALPIDPNPESEKYHALTTMVAMIASEVFPYGSPFRSLGEWLEDVVSPRWRGMRDELANLQFHNFNANTDYLWFISACLNTISSMLQEGLTNLGDFQAECGYPIKKSSWDVVQEEFPELSLNLTTKKYSSRDEEVTSEGPYSIFVRLYSEAKNRLINIISQRAKFKTQLERFFAVQVPTYGIYVPANSFSSDDRLKRWAFDRGVPTELTFPQSARVLFCLMAQERFEKETEKVLADRRIAHQMVRSFQRSVLIHEHFHAILETGLDEKRSSANGAKFDEAWRVASPLNESLAVWMELHNARQNPDLMELVWSYIRAGTYPQWPYRGAEKIETLYQKQGIGIVLDLIRSLRRDPESAQAEFDASN